MFFCAELSMFIRRLDQRFLRQFRLCLFHNNNKYFDLVTQPPLTHWILKEERTGCLILVSCYVRQRLSHYSGVTQCSGDEGTNPSKSKIGGLPLQSCFSLHDQYFSPKTWTGLPVIGSFFLSNQRGA